jgi:AsmA protein
LIGAVVSAALLIVFPPMGLIKDQLAKSLGLSIGRTVTIGAARLHFKGRQLVAELDDVVVSNPEGMPAGHVFHGPTVTATLDALPLIKGRVKIESLALAKPEFALQEAADGGRNWIFAPTPAGAASSTPAPTPTGTTGTSGPGTAPTTIAPTPTATTPASEPIGFRPPPVTTIEDGVFTFSSALTGTSWSGGDIDATVALDGISGALSGQGHLAAGGEALSFNVALGDFDSATAGKSSTLKANIAGRPVQATIDGDALFASEAQFNGKLQASTPSLLELAKWLGANATPSGEPIKTSLDGKIAVTTRDVTFTETDVMLNTTASRFEGNLDLGGVRPKLTGTATSEHIDLERIAGIQPHSALAPEEAMQRDFAPLIAPGWQRLLEDLNALAPEPGAAAAPAPAATPASPPWSEQPFNFNAIKALDLDMTISAADITYGGLDLKQGLVKAGITDGVLDAKLEQLAVGAGKATGTMTIDSRLAPPKATVLLTLTDVDAEPIITEISGKPLISGKSNVDINATASGQNQSQLTSTLEGKARFAMGKGALRGFDVRRMISEWWRGWSFDLGLKTGFEKLEAQYDIKQGVMRSKPGFEMDGSEVSINSTGSVNVAAKRLNQEVRIKVVPPPTALPIPVKITGDWAKPTIGIDWGGLFSASPGLAASPEAAEIGGPQAVATATEPPPPAVDAAIRRVLAADLPPERLSPEARRMLESLLPEQPAP